MIQIIDERNRVLVDGTQESATEACLALAKGITYLSAKVRKPRRRADGLIDPFRRCTRCGQLRSVQNFAQNGKGGWSAQCRSCKQQQNHWQYQARVEREQLARARALWVEHEGLVGPRGLAAEPQVQQD